MRSICSIIVLILATTSLADEKVPSGIIWYDGSTFYKSLDTKKNVTLFFPEWESSIFQFVSDKKYKVVLQLDYKLDPHPEDEVSLPNLSFLSSIADLALVEEYLDFLENYSRTLGYQHLVLPDTAGLSFFEKEVLQLASTSSPYYFISKGHIKYELEGERRDNYSNHSNIWISNQSVGKAKLPRWRKKANRKLDRSFSQGLEASNSVAYPTTTILQGSFKRRLYENAVVAIDPDLRLPLETESIVYLGNSVELKNRLADYVTVYDWKMDDAPILLDRRDGFAETSDADIVIDFLGKAPARNTTTLQVPSRIEFDEIIIARMLFGAQDVVGRSEIPGNRMIEDVEAIGFSSLVFEGMKEEKINLLDTVVAHAIRNYAMPGCQLAVVKNGSVAFEESFGHFTYDSLKEVSKNTMYDLASITKVLATLPAIALLIDQGKIKLEDSIGQYLPDFAMSNKSHVTIKELLAHNGGIRSYIPFWRRALNGDHLETFYYKTQRDEELDIRSYAIQPHPKLKDSLKVWIKKTDLIKNPSIYNYSDLGYMILHLLVESVSGESFDQFVESNFYEPMNLDITFNPLNKGHSYENIAPTEYDERYRDEQVWGEVHDRNAHAFGGIAGHAGLFANATDLAKMMHMLSNGGYYGGKQYLKEETLDLFNFRYFENNRRGLGWDKKDWEKDSASKFASDASFGHTGFTGTMVWADPEQDLIFVFLSNRIYPDSNNQKLMELNTRTEIHDVIYESILNE